MVAQEGTQAYILLVFSGFSELANLRIGDLLLVPHIPWLWRFFAFAWGAAWGSFLGMFVYRWPRELSIVSPGSTCPHCGAAIPFRHNIPIFAYFFLRGKTACCKKPLSPRYAAVELACALLALALVERIVLRGPADASVITSALEALSVFAFFAALVAITFIDLEYMLIPDALSLPIAALGLATVPIRNIDPSDAAFGAGLGFLIVMVPFVWVYEHLLGKRGMGEGDAKLLLGIGAFCGWKGVLFALAAGSLQGVIAFVLTRTWKKAPKEGTSTQNKIPFGPFLALGAVEFYFFGNQLIDWYLALFLPPL